MPASLPAAKRVPWLGAVYPSHAEPEGVAPFAAAVERLGVGQLWVIEDCFLASGIALAASALAVTDKLEVGIGLLPVPLRNPALAAMEIATLARIHPGRFTPAFGHGVRSWMQQAGALPPRRMQALEEYVSAIRALLAGDTVTTRGGYVTLDEVKLAMPPSLPPDVLVGSTGPRGIEIGHRAGTGILLPEGSGPEFVSWALQGAASRRSRCAVYAWLSIDDDPELAIDRVLPAVRGWALFEHYTYPRELAGLPGPPTELTDERLRQLAPKVSIAGSPASCAESVAALLDAGATDVLLMPQGDAAGELGRMAAEVIPALS